MVQFYWYHYLLTFSLFVLLVLIKICNDAKATVVDNLTRRQWSGTMYCNAISSKWTAMYIAMFKFFASNVHCNVFQYIAMYCMMTCHNHCQWSIRLCVGVSLIDLHQQVLSRVQQWSDSLQQWFDAGTVASREWRSMRQFTTCVCAAAVTFAEYWDYWRSSRLKQRSPKPKSKSSDVHSHWQWCIFKSNILQLHFDDPRTNVYCNVYISSDQCILQCQYRWNIAILQTNTFFRTTVHNIA